MVLDVNKSMEDDLPEDAMYFEFVDKKDDNRFAFLKWYIYCGHSACIETSISRWAKRRERGWKLRTLTVRARNKV